MTDSEFREAYSALVKDVATYISMENALSGRSESKRPKGGNKRNRDPDLERPLRCGDVANRVLKACREARARKLAATSPDDISDAALSRAARFTDKFALKSYEPFLHYVPRLVNVVTVCSPRPLPRGRAHPAPRAARRGHPRLRLGRHPPPRPPPHRRALQELLLRAQEVLRRPAGLRGAPLPRARLPHGQNGGHRRAFRPLP